MKKIIAFPWYGGKFRHLSFIYGEFPQGYTNIVDVCGGSGAVLLNIPPSRECVKTFNDIDDEVVNFFRTLREDGERLIEMLHLTPHAREELYRCALDNIDDDVDDTEKARRFLVRQRQTINGLADGSNRKAWRTRYGEKRTNSCARDWQNGVRKLHEVLARIQEWQIENMDALALLRRYDSRDVFFYLDPPYVQDARTAKYQGYRYDMSDKDHRALIKAAKKCKGRVLISGYENKMYAKLLTGWEMIRGPEKYIPAASHRKDMKKGRPVRQECLWRNYSVEKGML